ncbi:TOMM precursor leader peptide-binding protein [Arthrobacter sp.]|uniref:TOMM precursor leader peptide-binding protein n=1 Tax=Arthrobacter sp. TaxID=1667 RepID=UPI003A94537B
MRIIPGLQVVSVSEDTVRIGGPDDGLWISGLSATDQQFIRSLADEPTAPGEPRDTTRPWPGPGRKDELLALLAPVVEDPFRLPGALGATLVPDVNAYSTAYGTPAGQLLRARSTAMVRVWGLGRCGQAIAALLAASGVGALHLHDDLPVGAGDIGTGPLRLADLGKPRTVALAHRLGNSWPRTRLARWTPGPDGEGLGAHVSVVTACDALPDQLLNHLASTRVPHLPVVFDPASARIGPLVIPGLTTCLDCAQARTGRTVRGSRATGRPRAGSSTAELALSTTAAGLAALQVMMLLDGVNVPAAADAVLTVDLSTGGIDRVPIEPLPGCTCLVPAA